MAGRAFGVRPITRQQHAHMHLVGLRLQILKEAMNAIPLFGPVTLPVGIAIKHPVTVLLGKVFPGNVGGHTMPLGMHQQFFLAVRIRLRLPGFNRAISKAKRLIGNDKPRINANDAAKATAGLASPNGRVKREEGRARRFKKEVAAWAAQPTREAKNLLLKNHLTLAFAITHGGLNGLGDARSVNVVREHQTVCHDAYCFAFAGMHTREALGRQPFLKLCIIKRFRGLAFKGNLHLGSRGLAGDENHNAIHRVVLHRCIAAWADQACGARVKQFEVIGHLGHGAHGGP